MRYLLDTCAISDLYQGYEHALKKLKKTTPKALAISSITVAELRYGIAKIKGTKKSEAIRIFTDELLSIVTIISVDEAIAETAGEIKAELERSGNVTGAYDLLIAATAINKGLILVTSNTRDFVKIEGLVMQNWRKEE